MASFRVEWARRWPQCPDTRNWTGIPSPGCERWRERSTRAIDGAVPLEHLLRLASEVRIDAGVTIDLEASRDLGQPLIVLRLPAEEPRDSRLAALTRREREVAGLLAEGLSNKQLARRLAITIATVKDHVHRILRKSGLPNRTAIAIAWKRGARRTGIDRVTHYSPARRARNPSLDGIDAGQRRRLRRRAGRDPRRAMQELDEPLRAILDEFEARFPA